MDSQPAAHDPDGDALTYSLVPSRGFGGEFIPSFVFPDEVSGANDVFAIDESTGDLTWQTPQIAGEYNVAIRIEEWRDVGGGLRKVGEVIRDLQIDVQLCANQPPVVAALSDTCVLAGETLTFNVFASDPDGDPWCLSAVGGALTEVSHEAEFRFRGGGRPVHVVARVRGGSLPAVPGGVQSARRGQCSAFGGHRDTPNHRHLPTRWRARLWSRSGTTWP